MKERTIQAVGIFGIVAVFGSAFLAKFFVSDELTAVVLLVSLFLYVVTLVWILGVPAGRDAIKRWKQRSLPAPAEPVEARAQATSATEAKAQHAAATGIGCLGGTFIGVALLGGLLAQTALGIVFLLIVYGVVVLIFRYAFGVELWNPFG
jgi:hypothetical protein